MSEPSPHVVVLVTTASRDEAERIAEAAVGRRLAASAQIAPLRTWYRWKGEVQRAPEHQVSLFTRRACFDELAALVHAMHGYELPQVVAVPLVEGTDAFLGWIDDSTGDEGS